MIAVVKAACEALGSIALADDLGIKIRVRLHIDAAAALGILERQGVGRVRHLDIGVLWLQEQQLRRVVELTRVLSTESPPDLMTKHLAQESVNKYSNALGYEYRGGRSATTAKLHHVESKKVEVVQKERPEARQWHCVGDGHWRSVENQS